MNKRNLILAALILSVSLAFSAGSASPILQLTGYEVVPEAVYPGTNGQLELTIENTGTEPAKGTVVYYTYGSGGQWSIYLGDIGEGSEAITTIPFTVPDQVASGIVIINVDIYYLDDDETGSKHTMTSIPLTVSQHQVLEARTISLSKGTISKGEKLAVSLELENTGGIMKNVIISAANDSSFSIEGTTQKRVGDIEADQSRNVTVDLVSSSGAQEGRYSIPLVLTYQDALQNTVTTTIYVGPVTVSGSSSQMRIRSAPLSGSEIGSALRYNLTIDNTGSVPQSAVIVVEGTEVFTPIGVNTFYMDDIPAGGSRSEVITLGIDAASASGYYVLPVSMQTNGDEQEYEIGITVQATPEILLTSESEAAEEGTQVTVRVSNTGNTAIRSVYVIAEPTEHYRVLGAGEKFIGTLSVDDYATYSVTISPLGSAAGGEGLPLTVVFKDNDNKEHVVRETLAIQAAAGAPSVASNRTFSGRGPLAVGPSMANIPLYAGAGLVIIGGVYLGYRKFRGKKGGSDEARR
ncbi:MAG: hypothetical protein AB1324_06240 [Candidatus Micrarchaeota archaeon]